MKQFTCPECLGLGYKTEVIILERVNESAEERVVLKCFFCDGTGFASDEDTFEEFYRGDV